MSPEPLSRQLTLSAATTLVVGQVIAVGIFLTPGTIIRTLASPLWVLGIWTLMGGMAICGALCYGALAARYPEAGGGYVYLREAYGPRVAFLYGWKCFLIMDPGITAALATGFAAYTGAIVPLNTMAVRGVAILAIVVLAVVHILGLRIGTRIVTALTVLKLALILALIGIALVSARGAWQNLVPFVARRSTGLPLAPAIATALISAFFAFGGWWEVTKISGEVRNPDRTMPRALVRGLAAVTLVYMLITLAFMYVVAIEQVGAGEAFVAQVGTALLGPSGAIAVTLVVLACILGSLAVVMMVAPRMYFAMARDGMFPVAAAAVHPRFGTPARAIAVQASVACALVALGTFDTIVAYFIFITVVFIALTVAAVFVARRRDASVIVPGHPWTALIFLAFVGVLLVLMLLNNPLQALLGVAVVSLGAPMYGMIQRPAVPPAGTHQEVQS
jgi:basic amino acid/polyamine antiporter, APA family